MSGPMRPKILSNPLYKLLRDENISEFNKRRASGELPELKGGDFRGLDLRNLNAEHLDLTDAYFRGADLRGIDFRSATLKGASFADAKISGCYFPSNVSAQEILMSVAQGTRIRQPSPDALPRPQPKKPK